MTFTVTDSGSLPTPVLTAISPAYGTQNAPDTLITLHGSNFVPVSTVYLNSLQLSATYVNSTTITATIPASTLATPGSYPIYVNTEGPGGGNSYQFSFFVLPASGNGVSAFPVMANHVAWDPVRQLLYLSVSGASQTNPDSIQILDPIAGKLGGTVSIANEPDLLALSTTGKYLYVGLDNAPNIQRLGLPSLSPDITIPLGTRDGGSPNYAEDIQPSPVADNTVAVVRGIYEDFGQEWGGVVVYDDAAPRPLQVCGFYNTCGSLPNDATMSSVQWNSTADRLFGANDQNTEYNYSVSPVTASGIGATTVDIDNLLPGFGTKIYYDPITGYVISETGIVLQAATGVVVGHLPVPTGNIEYSISMAVDPTLGRVYAVYQTAAQAAGQDRTLDVYDGHNFTLISRNVLHNIAGSPQHLIRWGTNGLAFVAQVTGYSNVIPNGTVYLLTGDFINK